MTVQLSSEEVNSLLDWWYSEWWSWTCGMRASTCALVPGRELLWSNDRDIYPQFIQWHSWNSNNPFFSPHLDWFYLTQCLWGGNGGWRSTQHWPVPRPLGLKLPGSTQHEPPDPSADLLSADGSHTAELLRPRCPIPAGHGWEDGPLVSPQSDWLSLASVH